MNLISQVAGTPNARFKFRPDEGEVTLTLKPGQSLSWGFGEAHDEGWTHTGYTWSLDRGELLMAITTDGTDCDGRLTQHTDLTARLEEISADGWPNWQVKDASQRDYAAEAAGY
jgi:hypothetical protein